MFDRGDLTRRIDAADAARIASGELPAGGTITIEPGGQVELVTPPHVGPRSLIDAIESDTAHARQPIRRPRTSHLCRWASTPFASLFEHSMSSATRHGASLPGRLARRCSDDEPDGIAAVEHRLRPRPSPDVATRQCCRPAPRRGLRQLPHHRRRRVPADLSPHAHLGGHRPDSHSPGRPRPSCVGQLHPRRSRDSWRHAARPSATGWVSRPRRRSTISIVTSPRSSHPFDRAATSSSACSTRSAHSAERRRSQPCGR